MRFPYVRRKVSITPESNTADSQTPPRTASLLQLLPVRRGSATAIQVLPEVSTATKPHSTRIKPHELADVLYYWTTCLFIVALVCSQLLGAVWDSLTTTSHLYYGRNPQLGPSQIIGTNDVPYPDRVSACLRIGHFYEPRLVSSLLAAPGSTAILEDSTGTAVHGYRLRKRRVGSISDILDEATQVVMESSCALIAKTIDNIFDACSALGYSNLTRDHLRVVDDWESDDLYLLPNTLPILIMPYYDNTPYSRHAIPTRGGDACVFRLEDAYALEENAITVASFRGVNRSVRHERTVEWLKQPGGVCRNGWYEDTQGVR
ncbi:hypothetical protein V7S43_004782 [Phytophthora oleae]|uniref:Uncharacterized protein n=1 Tax=Phytophthora oleae TaxID=2107226 RepID=A0ABD3FUN8_9STRA